MAVNLIRKNNQLNVTAYEDTVLFHAIKGTNGVFPNVGDMFSLSYTASNQTMLINSGMGMVYGRQFEIKEGEEVTWDWSALTGVKYISVYVEIDLRDPTNETATFKSAYASGGYPSITDGDNLIASPTGVARLLMFWVYRNSAGTMSIATKYPTYRYDWVGNADFATNSTNATNASNSTKVGNNTITNSSGNLNVQMSGATTNEIVERRRLIYSNSSGIWLTTNGTATFNCNETINNGDVVEFYCAFSGSSIRMRIRTIAGIGYSNFTGVVGISLHGFTSAASNANSTSEYKGLLTVSGLTCTFKGAWDKYGISGLTVYSVTKIVGGNS